MADEPPFISRTDSMSERHPFGTRWTRAEGDVVVIVARGNDKLLIEHVEEHGTEYLPRWSTWVTAASADGWVLA